MSLGIIDIFFYVAGSILFLIGLLLIFSPNTLMKMERTANTLIITDSIFRKMPRLTGIVLVTASIYILFTYYRFL